MGLITILQNPRRLLNSRICPAITPVAGNELLVNGNMETGSPPTGWSPWHCTRTADASAHGGSQALKIVGDGINSDGMASESIATAVGAWYSASGWFKAAAGSLARLEVSGHDAPYSIGVSKATASIDYVNLCGTCRAVMSAYFVAVRIGNPAYTAYLDDITFKALTLSSLFTYLGRRSQRPGSYTCKPVLTVGTQCGLAIGYQDADNHILLYHDGVNAKLDKVISGTAASVISGAAAYGAGRELKVIVAANGTDYSLYYNGAKVGSTTAVADAGLGIAVYGFNTFAGNEVGLVTASPATT